MRTPDKVSQIQALAMLTEWLKKESDDDLDTRVVSDMHSIAAAYFDKVVAPNIDGMYDTVMAYDVKTSKDLKQALGDILLKVLAVDMAQRLGVPNVEQ